MFSAEPSPLRIPILFLLLFVFLFAFVVNYAVMTRLSKPLRYHRQQAKISAVPFTVPQGAGPQEAGIVEEPLPLSRLIPRSI